MEERNSKNRYLTWAVIVVSLAGIIYFGYQAITENSRYARENPFAYDVEGFKQSGLDRIKYQEKESLDIPLDSLSGLAIGQDDRLYVSGGPSILVFDPARSQVSRITAAGSVNCLAVDENGSVFVGLSDHVEVYHPDEAVWTRWASLGENAILTSIALTREFVFVADAGNHIVWRMDTSGTAANRIGDKDASKDIPGFIIPSPFFDVAIDPDGFLWVANTGRHSLENYTLGGDFRSSWGEFSMEIQGFCGCCNPSHFSHPGGWIVCHHRKRTCPGQDLRSPGPLVRCGGRAGSISGGNGRIGCGCGRPTTDPCSGSSAKQRACF